jgi:tetratricopeptide (TPR) repeat protein
MIEPAPDDPYPTRPPEEEQAPLRIFREPEPADAYPTPRTVPPEAPAGEDEADPYPTRRSVLPPEPIHPRLLAEAPDIPGHEVLGQLGKGGMGVVYKARHLRLNRVVALKRVLHADDAAVKLFHAEAEAVARLQHPHIIQIYEIGDHDGQPFFSLEYCPGGSLDRRLAGKPLAEREAAALVRTLAGAVAAAHEKGIVHRDLKPANVLIAEDGAPKVTDFGLAKRLDVPGQTQAGAILGTPQYMAPEQAAGQVERVGPAADVWALGAILYECLTGRPPFLAATTFDVLMQVCEQEPVGPRSLQPGLSRDPETICLKCLRKDMTARYVGAADLADDLGRFLRREPIHARPVPAWERAGKWARRHPARAGFLAAGCLAVLGALSAGLFYVRYKDQELRAAEKKLHAKSEVERLLGQSEQAAKQGMDALKRKRYPEALDSLDEADRLLGNALATLDADPDADEGKRAQITARRQALKPDRDEGHRQVEKAARAERLRQDRHEVHLHEISPTGREQADNREHVRALAPAALARFLNVPFSGDPLEALEQRQDRLVRTEKKQAEDCYAVLLAWAEAEAGRTPPAGARRALRLLDVAAAVAGAHEVPTPRAYFVRQARYHTLAGNDSEAAAAAALAVAQSPCTPLDHFLAALDLHRQRKHAEAEAECARVLQKQADHFWAQYLQALCCLHLKQWALAKSGFTACLLKQPDALWPLALRAVALAEMGKVEEAQTDFADALKRASEPHERYMILADRAVLWAKQRLWQEATADLAAATALQPHRHEAHVTLAEVHRQRGDLKGAVAALDRAIACRAADPSLYYTRARRYLDLKDPVKARQDFRQVIARTPKGDDGERLLSALVERGMIEHQAGRLVEALTDFRAALAIRPTYAPAHRQQAETLLKLNRWREAGQALDRYLAHCKTPLAPANATVYLARGLIHSELREHGRAVDAYTRALMLRPEPVRRAEALAQRGWTYLKLESPALALGDFEEAVQLRPAHASSLCGRAHAKVQLGKVSEAVSDAEAALKLDGGTEQELRVACIYARAARLLSLTAPSRQRGTARPEARCREGAVSLVCHALGRLSEAERSAYWHRRIVNEPALEAIRRHPRVAALVPAR